MDMAIRNQISPSFEKMKVEVDIVEKLTQRVRINEHDDVTVKLNQNGFKFNMNTYPSISRSVSCKGMMKKVVGLFIQNYMKRDGEKGRRCQETK